MNKGFDRRNYNFEIRAEEDSEQGKVITGRPIIYDSKTDLGYFEEVIESGALDKADLTDVRFLVNHDTSKIPLARSRKDSKDSTMQLEVDNKGLSIRVNLDVENNSEARNLYSAVQRRDISGMSFMFGINDEEWENLDSDYPTRRIKAISNVVEVSAVTFPAYGETEISTRNKEALDKAKKTIDEVRSNNPSNDDLELEKLKAKYLYNL